jgi:uncharacterized membrane protein
MAIFSKAGLGGAFLIAHVVVAMMWMGLLWFFNFVQTPAYAEMDGAARNNAFDKLTWRALWWFRWAAVATVAFGLLVIAIGGSDSFSGDFWKSSAGVTLLIGILFGITMLYNVWMIIWPNQQIVIANARKVQGGGEADPAAPAAARAGAMASRQNTIFSLPLLVFMVGASHFYALSHFANQPFNPSGAKWFIFLLIGIGVLVVLELNALGKISGRGNTGLNVIYETHINALYTGIGLIVGFYILAEILLRA